jgi:hypothetical protein
MFQRQTLALTVLATRKMSLLRRVIPSKNVASGMRTRGQARGESGSVRSMVQIAKEARAAVNFDSETLLATTM